MPDSNFHGVNLLCYISVDYQQSLIGACKLDDVAVRVVTRVIGHYPDRGYLLVDCGFTAISHDGMRQQLPQEPFCLVDGHPNLKLVKKVILLLADYFRTFHLLSPANQRLKYHTRAL